ncbi:MAG TPA: efflux RND transporter periplasmic adaptor subunit [Cyclobacteriaceae bacterium]|nr:efflux RND transporter periplasmic adaptor subunit [Cyclobacteriaceae bacterium]
MNKIIPVFLSGLVVFLQACGPKAEVTNIEMPSELVPVTIMKLSRTPIRPVIPVSGQLTTDDETPLSFKTGGLVKRVTVKEGDVVRKGQLLATLDLTEIQAQVSQARLTFEKTQRDANRVARLHRDSVATLEQYQNSQTGLEIARRQLEAAEFNLTFSEIRAISDGFVLKKYVSDGQVVAPGAPILLTNGAHKSQWLLRAGLSDREWSMVIVGDSAEVRIDAVPDKVFKGVVTRKSEGADPMTGSFMVEVTTNDMPRAALAAGMFGRAQLRPSNMVLAWRIPYDALLDGDATHGYVFVTNDNQTAHKVKVGISGINKEFIEVTSGLEGAASLIVSGSAYLVDKAAIRIINKP